MKTTYVMRRNAYAILSSSHRTTSVDESNPQYTRASATSQQPPCWRDEGANLIRENQIIKAPLKPSHASGSLAAAVRRLSDSQPTAGTANGTGNNN
jgi:hypothetical protein